jgi:16S rRNA (cytidine1402-2'-O)-methyltransferase
MQANFTRPALYVVATPIGNLGDITLRALDVLRAVDVVAAEDTRVTVRLLHHFGIEKPLISLHQHNERRATERLLDALRAGQAIALTSDAGTPAISDPGARLVATVRDAGFPCIPIPGVTALTTAWSVAGFEDTAFLFCGFLPKQAGERRRAIAAVARITHPLIFYEAPHRVHETATDLAHGLGGERRVVVGRELTKLFETVHATTLDALRAWFEADEVRSRGEFVLIVAGAPVESSVQGADAEALLNALLEELPSAQASRIASRVVGVPKKTLYELAVKLKNAARDKA